MSEAELERIFKEKWREWIRDFTARLPKVYQQDINIATSVERCLRDLLRKHNQQVIEALNHRPLREWGKPLHLAIQPERHLQTLRWFSSHSLAMGIKKEDIEYAQRETEGFLQMENQYLLDLRKI